VALLSLVPIPHAYPVEYTIHSGSFGFGHGPNFSVSHKGWIDFAWTTNLSASSMIEILNDSVEVYVASGSSGSGQLTLYPGNTYDFIFSAAELETLTVSGTIHFTAPLL